ncbi:MAG TPA: cytochrome-c oxidase, cbb3-type subunit III [Dokdonella sp.]|uniref:cytochrome-c oxidase, cbb3-type subunit III n=1 Tax=Dokdonella sp. TaxID=2291710 RepID=UPI002D7E5C4D|nr:cytochrome-c oxidase, cbb3-type subunit III [Dokdonella sp.]HET9032065.1 cytochrome-c oxidase, cbb3-type subunit III [Dokdonella sp.]
MSTFWSAWVMFLVVFNLGITLFLFLWGQRVRIPLQPDGTTGHVWAHGTIREAVRKLPAWWVWVSASMFVAGIGYLILYPGFGASKGVLGWTSGGELARDVASNDAKLAPMMERLRSQPVEKLASDGEVIDFGHRLFLDNCAGCHGRQAHGNPLLGAPNLGSGGWMYGGTGDDLLASILDGRRGQMPPFSATFDEATVKNIANYVLSLSGAQHDAKMAAEGQPQFAVCSACHGADGTGNVALGAPNLTDAIWVHGGDEETIEATIKHGRSGVMPSWRPRLGEERSRAVAAWVFANAQGEASAQK